MRGEPSLVPLSVAAAPIAAAVPLSLWLGPRVGPFLAYLVALLVCFTALKAAALLRSCSKPSSGQRWLFAALSPVLLPATALTAARCTPQALARQLGRGMAFFATAAVVCFAASRLGPTLRGAYYEPWLCGLEFYLLLEGLWPLGTLHWRALGYAVEPLFDRPYLATSPAEFWGRRWNRVFHAWLLRCAHLPLAQRMGGGGAVLATFTLSGLLHEALVNGPARGQVASMTAYFLVQGFGVLLLHPRRAKGPRALHRAITLSLVLVPAGMLFTEAFYAVLPMHRLFWR